MAGYPDKQFIGASADRRTFSLTIRHRPLSRPQLSSLLYRIRRSEFRGQESESRGREVPGRVWARIGGEPL